MKVRAFRFVEPRGFSLIARALRQRDVIVTDSFIDQPLRVRLHLLVAS